ncbi:MAG: helix-turn-helix transcriptional regulator [Oscillospiraceae bacterium]|jgi:hypothetical protein|nr:helix-turn-helix transcriptional regulator [Oscillospiraceae bacterium]
MPVFDMKSTQKAKTPWGKQVEKRLIDTGMSKKELLDLLSERGFKISKYVLHYLLYGQYVNVRLDEIQAISAILGIHFVA